MGGFVNSSNLSFFLYVKKQKTDWFWEIGTIILWDTNEKAVKNLIQNGKQKRSLVNKILFHIVKR